MKKYFYMIGSFVAAMLVGLLVPVSIGSAASSYDANQSAMGVIGTVNTGTSYDLSLSKAFQSSSSYGMDLYNLMYNKVRNEGSDLAVQRTLGDHDFSKEELSLLIPGSNISELLRNPSPTTQLNNGQIRSRQEDLIAQLAEEKELADLETETQREVTMTEIFANGDESDSGFDLISDLNIIEAILFGAQENQLGNAGPGAPAGSNVYGPQASGSGGSNNGAQGNARENPGGSNGSQNPQGPGGSGTGSGTNGGSGGPHGGGAGTGQSGSGNPASPGGTTTTSTAAGKPGESVSCPLNPSFNEEALRAGAAAGTTTTTTTAGQGGTSGSGGAAGGSQNPGGGVGGNNQNNNGGPPPGSNGNNGAPNQSGAGQGSQKPPAGNGDNGPAPEQPGKWSRPDPCSDIFCLKVEAIYKKASSYQSKDNCIACHFEKINEAMKKTVDHNLAPSKATGNIGEGSKCKRQMLNLKWNLVMIPQPILTPPNDDLVTKGDFIKNLQSFYEQYYNNPGRCSKVPGGACKPDPDPLTEATDKVLSQTPPDADPQQVIADIKAQAASIQKTADDAIAEAEVVGEAADQSEQFRVLLQEIDTMNGFFKSFVKIMSDFTSADNKDSACSQLKSKDTCE